jgi:hypothetical protein
VVRVGSPSLPAITGRYPAPRLFVATRGRAPMLGRKLAKLEGQFEIADSRHT